MRITNESIYNQFTPDIKPQAFCESGQQITFETVDALFGMSREIFFCADKFPKGFTNERANPATGPLYIEGAKPGDVIEVKINRIKCIGKGYFVVPNRGTPNANTVNGREYIEIEMLESGEMLELSTGRRFPARPMIGVIGTASNDGRPWFATETGSHGGNMDNNIVRSEATILFPVFVEGGLLGIGDVHAAMGDGEVFGQGVEVCAEVDVTVTVRKDIRINRPFIMYDTFISSVASADSMEEASRLCIEDMRDVLETIYKMTPSDAAMAIALYGDLKVCQIVNSQKTMRLELELKSLALFSGK